MVSISIPIRPNETASNQQLLTKPIPPNSRVSSSNIGNLISREKPSGHGGEKRSAESRQEVKSTSIPSTSHQSTLKIRKSAGSNISGGTEIRSGDGNGGVAGGESH